MAMYITQEKVDKMVSDIFDEKPKPISLTKKEYFEIDIAVIDHLVKELVGRNVELIADDELHNGYTPCDNMIAEDNTEAVEKFRNKEKWHFMGLHQWIEHLIFLGKMPEGNYLVDHSW